MLTIYPQANRRRSSSGPPQQGALTDSEGSFCCPFMGRQASESVNGMSSRWTFFIAAAFTHDYWR